MKTIPTSADYALDSEERTWKRGFGATDTFSCLDAPLPDLAADELARQYGPLHLFVWRGTV